MSEYAVITQNDESAWDDIKGDLYHYPSTYKSILTTGCNILYYKGKMRDRAYASQRLSPDPHYFGTGVVGDSIIDPQSDKKDRYCEILNYQEFEKAVPFKINGQYLEEIPKSKRSNYWRFGVRHISQKVFYRIFGQATLTAFFVYISLEGSCYKMKIMALCLISLVSFFVVSCSTYTAVFEYEDPYAPNVGDKITIKGFINKPNGEGPFPAVILLHPCSGINDNLHNWARTINGWGYVSLIINSFGPRHIATACNRNGIHTQQAHDAHAARTYLRSLSFVDPNKIAVMGFSHGARASIHAIFDKHFYENEKSEGQFAAAISFYPYCNQYVRPYYDPYIKNRDAPIMVLIGAKDTWTPARDCEYIKRTADSKHEAIVVVYPNAYHGFDVVGANGNYRGHRILYDPEATADSKIRVKAFLKKHFSKN